MFSFSTILGNPESSVLSEREIWGLLITCALFVHFVYNHYEPQPSNILPTLFLLVVVPALPTTLFLSHLSAQSALTDTLRTASLAFLSFYIALLCSIVTYRLSPFHPLAEIPGPRMSHISQWLCAAMMVGRQRHKYFKKLHDHYGPYVRVGPNEVSCSEARAIPIILGTNGWRKGPMWNARHIPGREPFLVGLQDHPIHHERRKTWARGLSTAAVKGYEAAIEHRVNQLASELEKFAFSVDGSELYEGKSVDLVNWLSRFSFDFMGDMAFGGGFNLMTEGDIDGVWHLMESALMQNTFIQYAPYLLPIIWKVPFLVKSIRKIVAFSEDQIIKRLERRLREEVDMYFPLEELEASVSIVDSAKLADMPYLNAVINEALRLQPSITVNIQRATFDEWKWTGSQNLPPGTAINIPPYVVHRDPKYFHPIPDTFWPDRWLPLMERKYPSPSSLPAGIEKVDINNVTTDVSAFIPFSHGPANCAGKNLAILVMRSTVSYLLRRFDIRLDDTYDTSRWEKEGEDYFTFQNGSLPVRLTRRV